MNIDKTRSLEERADDVLAILEAKLNLPIEEIAIVLSDLLDQNDNLRKNRGGSFEYLAKVESVLIEIDKETFQLNSDSRDELIMLINELIRDNAELESKINISRKVENVLSEEEIQELLK